MSNFDYWYNEVADTPEKDKDGWYDLDTGLRFDPKAVYQLAKKPARKMPSKALSDRDLAKFFGGKALKGTHKQKIWAEKIRAGIIKSGKLDEEALEKLMTCGGFTDYSKFWIENRDVAPEKMTAENIVSSWSGLCEIEQTHRETLVRSGPRIHKEKAREEIKAYIASCDFNFESDYVK